MWPSVGGQMAHGIYRGFVGGCCGGYKKGGGYVREMVGRMVAGTVG